MKSIYYFCEKVLILSKKKNNFLKQKSTELIIPTTLSGSAYSICRWNIARRIASILWMLEAEKLKKKKKEQIQKYFFIVFIRILIFLPNKFGNLFLNEWIRKANAFFMKFKKTKHFLSRNGNIIILNKRNLKKCNLENKFLSHKKVTRQLL